MSNAVLAYTNYYTSGVVTASTEAKPKENAYDNLLSDYWQPDLSLSPSNVHTVDVDMTTAQAVDVFGFYSSDLYTFAGATCALYWSDDDISYTLVDTITPTTIGPKLLLTTSSSHRYWRMEFATTTPQQPKVQHIILGPRLTTERGIGVGFSPMALGSENVPINSESGTGLFIGRSTKKMPVRTSMTFSNLSQSWVRANWPSILSATESGPFMALPSPDVYPGEAAYCWTDGPIRTPTYSQPQLISLTIKLKARIT